MSEKILITIDRDVMWEYMQYYFKTNPRSSTFPFAKETIDSLLRLKIKSDVHWNPPRSILTVFIVNSIPVF